MATFDTTLYLCRVGKTTRTFANYNNLSTSGNTMQAGTMFYSKKNIKVGNVTMYEVTSSYEDSIVDTGVYLPGNILDTMEILEDAIEPQNATYNDSVVVSDTLIVTSTNVTVYDRYDSTNPLQNDLMLQDIITADQSVNILRDGISVTVYRIANINGDTNHSLVGKWVLSNNSITNTSINIIPNNTTPVNSLMSRNVVAPIDDPSIGDAVGDYVGDVAGAVIGAGVDVTASVVGLAFDISPVGIAYNALTGLYEAYSGDDKSDAKDGWTMTDLLEMQGITSTSSMGSPVGRMTFVHGMPFQYTYLTDRRMYTYGSEESMSQDGATVASSSDNEDKYGRTFAKEIACNMPIAVIVPGEPVFLTNVKDGMIGYEGSNRDAKSTWAPLFSDLTSGQFDTIVSDLLTSDLGDYQYYSMEISTTSYFAYVNALCQTSARLMGLTDFKYNGQKCDNITWNDYNNSAEQDYSMFDEIVGVSGGVSFAYDPLSSISDNISNTTTESQYASSVTNQVSSAAKELNFLAGTAGWADENVLASDGVSAFVDGIASFADTVSGGIFGNIAGILANSAKGMNVRFPNIWSDSNNNRSYDIDMRFITPYATPFCKWRYVLVPFFHIFCLAAPRSEETLMAYASPFLIRAFSKGYFNVEMGMIESIQWKRFGDGDMISEDGIPTQIDVTISFQDLYQQLAMSQFGDYTADITRIGVFFNNTGLMDMLGTLSGVNMNRISFYERIALYTSSTAETMSNVGTNFMGHISDRVRNVAETYLYGI